MPKKLIIIVAILTFYFQLLTFNCCAQPNGGFENWTPEFSYENPDGWQTLNFLSLTNPPNPISCFKTIGIDVHSGNYAMKLKTIYVNNNPMPNQINDSTSGTFTGKINISPVSYTYGFPYIGRPEKLEFWYKYTPVDIDTAGVVVFLRKWNGTGHDTIAGGMANIVTSSFYSIFQLTLTYFSTEAPDSATIAFRSSNYYSDQARVGSTLFIDDVAFTGWVGIDEHCLNCSDKIKTFPNPAKNNVTILAQIEDAENARIFDSSGKLVGENKIQNNNAIVNTSSFAAGIYFFEILDKQKNVLSNGKFSVVK